MNFGNLDSENKNPAEQLKKRRDAATDTVDSTGRVLSQRELEERIAEKLDDPNRRND